MLRTVTATEARVHFGQLMQQVVQSNQPTVVEKTGQPQVVIVSAAMYEQVRAQLETPAQEDALARIIQAAAAGRTRKGCNGLPAAADMVNTGRETRDAHLR